MSIFPDESLAPSAWADGFGVWHACVPDTGNRRRDIAAAWNLIFAELTDRSAPGVTPVFAVTLKRCTEHGTLVFAESTPS